MKSKTKVENVNAFSYGMPMGTIHHFASAKNSPEELNEAREKLNKISAKSFMERNKVDACEVRDEKQNLIKTYTWDEVKDAY